MKSTVQSEYIYECIPPAVFRPADATTLAALEKPGPVHARHDMLTVQLENLSEIRPPERRRMGERHAAEDLITNRDRSGSRYAPPALGRRRVRPGGDRLAGPPPDHGQRDRYRGHRVGGRTRRRAEPSRQRNGQFHLRKPPKERRQRHLRLQPGQRRTGAAVRAVEDASVY
ncbi:hypothetical protein Ntsu_28950 [Nocardia sp. IFM 10818]